MSDSDFACGAVPIYSENLLLFHMKERIWGFTIYTCSYIFSQRVECGLRLTDMDRKIDQMVSC